jgi:Protein of unknown function (DUF4446)
VDELTTVPGIAALVAGGLALIALVICLVQGRRLRQLRRSQSAVLGEGGERDLAEHAADLQARFERLAADVERGFGEIRTGQRGLDERLDGAVAHVGVVRYDAMNEMTGRQSSSVALLDASRNGVVISSILSRDQARLYAKQLVDGRSEMELSPEEHEAVDAALGGKGR